MISICVVNLHLGGGNPMAKDKLEYLESKYSSEEAQDFIDKGYKYLFGKYVTQEEHDDFWRSQERPTVLESLAPLILLATAVGVVTGVVKGVQWLTSWRIEK